VNSRHNATNSVALSPTISAVATRPHPDRLEFQRWLTDHADEFFALLLPDGELSDGGLTWHAGDLSIQRKGPKAGCCFSRALMAHGKPIQTLGWATGEPWPKSFECVAHLVDELNRRAAATIKPLLAQGKPNGHVHAPPPPIDAQPPTPNGHGPDHQPIARPAKGFVPPTATGAPRANGVAAAPQPGHGGDENRPFWTGPSNAAEPEIIPPARTVDQILTEARTLTRDPTPAMVDRLNSVLRHIAEARLDPATTDMVMSEIKRHSGIGMGSLRDALKAIRQQVRATVSPMATPDVTTLCRRYVYVKAVGAFWDRLTRAIATIDAVRHAHWAEMPFNDYGEPSDPRDVMVKGQFGAIVDRVDKITFLPGSSEIVTEDGAKCLNVWTPPDIVPKAGDATPFLNHIDYILDSDAAAISYLLDYLAHLVQKPWIKIKSAPLIIGEPGIGKSLIGEMIATIIGRRNATAIEESDLRSQFNEWIDGKLLVIVHELMTLDRQETMNPAEVVHHRIDGAYQPKKRKYLRLPEPRQFFDVLKLRGRGQDRDG
jgi:hypothetical protein